MPNFVIHINYDNNDSGTVEVSNVSIENATSTIIKNQWIQDINTGLYHNFDKVKSFTIEAVKK